MIRLWRTEEAFWVEFPYHEGALSSLKAAIPLEGRDPYKGLGWSPEERRWGFDISYFDDVLEILARYFPEEAVVEVT